LFDMAALGMSCHGCLVERHDKFNLHSLYSDFSKENL
jgi:hypothetical protein